MASKYLTQARGKTHGTRRITQIVLNPIPQRHAFLHVVNWDWSTTVTHPLPRPQTTRILQTNTKTMSKKRLAAFKTLLLLARFVLNFVRPASVDEG